LVPVRLLLTVAVLPAATVKSGEASLKLRAKLLKVGLPSSTVMLETFWLAASDTV